MVDGQKKGSSEQLEEELKKNNRALKLLSATNQALIRATEESALMHEICRIVIESGYRLAWVGIKEEDEAKSVRPVAQDGFESGYLEAAKITWADTERGRGPTGTAIRTGKPAICRNMLTDPSFLPWREQAVKRGYQSSIALPLVSGEKTFGALNIYAVEPDAFDEQEVKILNELASDMIFGIIFLRGQAERKRAEEELKQREQQFRLLFENAPVGFGVIDLKGKLLAFNKAILQPGGYSEEDIWEIGNVTLLYFNVEQREEALARFKKQGVLIDFPVQFKRKDGTPYDAKLSLAQTTFEGRPAVQAIVEDVTERKRAEEKLKESEIKFSKLFHSAPLLMAVSTLKDGRFIEVNDYFLKDLGYAKEEIIGRTSGEIGLFVEPHKRLEALELYLRDGEFRDLEVSLRSKDGVIHPMLLSAEVITFGGERYLLAQALDVAERKKIEKALQTSEEKFLKAFRSSPISLTLAGVKDGVLMEANHAFEKITGYSIAEALGKTAHELDLYPDPHERERLVEKLKNEGQVRNAEMHLRNKSGESRTILVSSEPITIDKSEYILSATEDITDRKRAEEKEKEYATRLEYLSKYANDLIILLDENFRFLETNERVQEFYGYTRDELIGMHAADFRAPETKDAFNEQINEVVRSGKGFYETIHQRKDGSKFPVEISLRAIDVEGKRLYQAIIRDISDRKKAEGELKTKMEELKLINDAAIGRELKMIDLEKEVDSLREELGREPKYK